MKHVRMLALAIVVILFAASCSKDKGDKPGGNFSVKGTWNLTHIRTIEPNDDVYDYNGEAGDYMEFTEDGELFTKVGEYENTETYEVIDAKHLKKGGYDADIKELTQNKTGIACSAARGSTVRFNLHLSKINNHKHTSK